MVRGKILYVEDAENGVIVDLTTDDTVPALKMRANFLLNDIEHLPAEVYVKLIKEAERLNGVDTDKPKFSDKLVRRQRRARRKNK